MQLNRAALNQNRLKSLDTQAVQSRRTVQQYWMVFNDLFQHVPYFRLHTFYKTLGALDIVGKVLLHQLAHHKWLEEFQRHALGQATLMQLQFWPDHDNGTARVVNALTQ